MIYRNLIEFCQLVHDFLRIVVYISNLKVYVMSSGYSNQISNLFLHQPHMMATPAEPVLHIWYIFIILILLIKQLRFQQLARGYQSETMDIHRCIPHIAVRSGTKDVYIFRNRCQNTPFWLFSALGGLMWNHKRICERIAFSIHLAP